LVSGFCEGSLAGIGAGVAGSSLLPIEQESQSSHRQSKSQQHGSQQQFIGWQQG
jgi:hypothetical protein